MNLESDREKRSPAFQRPAYELPAHVKFKQRQKEVSLVRPFLLALLMLLAVVLLAPAIRMLRQPEPPRAGLVDDVEEREIAPPPELPEPFYEMPVVEIPDLLPDNREGPRPSHSSLKVETRFPELIQTGEEPRQESMGAMLRDAALLFDPESSTDTTE